MESHGGKYFIPLVWAQSAINMAKKEGRIKEDIGAQKLFTVSFVHFCFRSSETSPSFFGDNFNRTFSSPFNSFIRQCQFVNNAIVHFVCQTYTRLLKHLE